MNTNHQGTKDIIRVELESARASFHALLDSLSENELQKRSLNPGWTNGEILAHILFGFIILNAFTVPFNWVNALGARLQAWVFTYKRIGKIYDWVYFSLVKQINSIKDDEWERGMHYPTQWDSNFNDFMTIEKLFHYPVIHFNFHLEQIAR